MFLSTVILFGETCAILPFLKSSCNLPHDFLSDDISLVVARLLSLSELHIEDSPLLRLADCNTGMTTRACTARLQF
jgi:hypothetical protein